MKHLQCVLNGHNKPGSYVATLLLTFVGLALLGFIPLSLAMLSEGIMGEDTYILWEILPQNTFLLLMFSSFAIGLAVLYLCIRLFHHRRFTEVVNGGRPLRWGHFFSAFGLYVLFVALFQGLLLLLDSDNYVWQYDARAFWSMLPVLLVCVPLQTLFEEFLFRGYLMQMAGVWTRRVWLAWLLPALVFGLAHSANPEVGAYGFFSMMLQYVLFGLIFGWFTIVDDGIEVSWGMHTANNLFLLLFFTTDYSALPTSALWRMEDAAPTWYDPLSMLVVGLLVWLLLKRNYHWKRPDFRARIESREEEELKQENN